MTRLFPCPTCQRHVRCDDRCPFCGGALPTHIVVAAEPAARLGRAAIMTFRTAALAAVGATTVACGASTGLGDPDDAGADAGVVPSGVDAGFDAGAPPGVDAGPLPTMDAGFDAGVSVIPAYGVPPPPPPLDAGPDDAGGSVALYGDPSPPPDAGPEGGLIAAYGTPAPG